MAQRTLITLTKAVCTELNLPQPSAVISSTDQNVLKLLGFVRATCDDMVSEHDWQVLQKRYTFTTTNGDDTYAFPTDLERFISGTFYDTTTRWPMNGSLPPGQWEYIKSMSLASSPFKRFRVFGDQITLDPVPGATPVTCALEYISSSYVRDGTTQLTKADFEADSDICLFDHRLIIYGTKLKFLASISQDTTAALIEFQRALDYAKGTDSPAPRLSLLGGRVVPLLSTANLPETGFGS